MRFSHVNTSANTGPCVLPVAHSHPLVQLATRPHARSWPLTGQCKGQHYQHEVHCSAVEEQQLAPSPPLEPDTQATGPRREFRIEVLKSINDVNSEDWNAVACSSGEINPFVLHGFLQALEDSKSAVSQVVSTYYSACSSSFVMVVDTTSLIISFSSVYSCIGAFQLIPALQVKEEGWVPHHILVREGESNELLGCCPLYLKVSNICQALLISS